MYTINGCGTRLYGHTQVQNGYIATKWFCFIFVPIIPISSYLVLDETENYNYVISSSKTYNMVKLDKIYRPHIKGFFILWAFILLVIIILSLK